MGRRQKAQTAMEYLMTYGWAILIVIVVAGVLAYYGVFSPGKIVGPTKSGFAKVEVLQWDLVATNGQIKLYVENRVGDAITVNSIQVKKNTDAAYGSAINTGTISLAAGGRAWVVNNTALTYNVGDSYNIDVKVIYTYQGQSLSSTGSLSGTIS